MGKTGIPSLVGLLRHNGGQVESFLFFVCHCEVASDPGDGLILRLLGEAMSVPLDILHRAVATDHINAPACSSALQVRS